MKKASAPRRSTASSSKKPRAGKGKADTTRTNTDEFERKGMGLAPKE